MKKFVSILTVVIFSLALLPMLGVSEAAVEPLFVLGGFGGDGGVVVANDDYAKAGGSGYVNSADSRVPGTYDTYGPLANGATSIDITLKFIMPGIGNTDMVTSGDIAEASGAGGRGGSADVRIASRDVSSLEVVGGDSGEAVTNPGGAGGFARLRVSEDLRVNGYVEVRAGNSLDVRGPGSADLTVGGKLVVGEGYVGVFKEQTNSGDVSFSVGELVVSPDGMVPLVVDGLASRDVKIPIVTLGLKSWFGLTADTSLDMGAYGTKTLNVDKDVELADIYIELRSGDVLSFNIANAGSGDVMMMPNKDGIGSGVVVDIKSADNPVGNNVRGGIQLNGASGLQVGSYITLIKADRLVSKDYGTTTLVSRVPGSNTGYAFSISYVGNEMRATYKGTTHIGGGGGSSGCSAIGFAPFAILLILGAATLGKRK